MYFAMSCFPVAQVCTVSERTCFSVQQVSRERGYGIIELFRLEKACKTESSR